MSHAPAIHDRIDALADEIAEVSARIDASKQYLMTLIREFDQLKGWARQGAKGPVQWFAWRVGYTEGTARENVRVARALGDLPLMDAALKDGTMSYTKVRAMTRVATPETEELLLAQARTCSGAVMEKVVRGIRRTKQIIDNEAPERQVRRRQTRDGMVKIEIKLFADEADAVWKALVATRDRLRQEAEPSGDSERLASKADSAEAAASESVVEPTSGVESEAASAEAERELTGSGVESEAASAEAEPDAANMASKASQSAPANDSYALQPETNSAEAESLPEAERPSLADAVLVIAEDAMTREPSPPRAGPDRRTLFVHVQHDLLTDEVKAETHDHRPLRLETLKKIACDCGLIAASRGEDGHVVSLSTKRRTVTEPLRRALMLRDRHCAFPGCQCSLYLEAHHVKHWLEGGETSLDNLVLLCWTHHALLHREGFRAEHVDGQVCFFEPSGREIVRAPQPPPYVGAPLQDITDTLEGQGIHIDALTALPDWDGSHQDWRGAIDAVLRKIPWAKRFFDSQRGKASDASSDEAPPSQR